MPVERWGLQHGKTIHWLLDLTFAGRVFRFAQAELDVADAENATTYQYHDGIVGDLVHAAEWDFGSDTISANRVSLELLFPVDVAELVAEGHDLAAATAELSRWIEGDDYDDRKTVLVGLIRDPEYGEAGVSVRCSLEENFFDDRGALPARGQMVNSRTTYGSQIAQADKNLSYPVILGRPGKFSYEVTGGTTKDWIPAAQALWWYKFGTESNAMLVAAGHTASDYAYLTCDGVPDGVLVKLSKLLDRAGQQVTLVGAGTATSTVDTKAGAVTAYHGMDNAALALFLPDPASIENTVAVFVSWFDPVAAFAGTDYGGVESGGESVRRAGDVIEYVLSFSSIRFDRPAIKAMAPRLASFLIDAVIDSKVTPWEWIRDNLLPILPLSVVTGPTGVRFIFWDYAATAEDAIATIDADLDTSIEFDRRIKVDTSKIVNKLSLKFAKNLATNSYQGIVSAIPEIEGDYATTWIVEEVPTPGDPANIILVTARERGMDGWIVEMDEVGAGVTIVEDAARRHITIQWDVGVHTATDIVLGVNASNSSISAELVQGTGAQLLGIADFDTAGPEYTLRERAVDRPSRFGLLSASRYKNVLSPDGIFEETIESAVVYDEATAHAVLAWKLMADAFAKRTVEALLPEHAWDWLQLGNVVLLRKASLHLVDQVALVQAIETGNDGMIAARFLILENPDRDAHYGV